MMMHQRSTQTLDDEQQQEGQERPEEQQQQEQEPGDQDQEQQDQEQQQEGEQLDGDTFPRSYVEKLRDESHGYRTERNAAVERVAALTAAVWDQQLTLDGRLADNTDIAMPEDFDGDPESVTAAVTELLESKPHLAARRAGGDIGQHSSNADTNSGSFSFTGAMAANA